MRTIGRSYIGVLLAAVLLPGSSWALGFGDIRLKSALNAPLDAEIEISATPDELGSVRAGLASREQFARSGMEYPAFLNTATVRLAKTADGHDVLQVRTTDPVTEPFLTMLVQVSYARGQLIREYTVLLDPPVFAGQSAAAVVSAPSAGTQARTGDLEETRHRPHPPLRRRRQRRRQRLRRLSAAIAYGPATHCPVLPGLSTRVSIPKRRWWACTAPTARPSMAT